MADELVAEQESLGRRLDRLLERPISSLADLQAVRRETEEVKGELERFEFALYSFIDKERESISLRNHQWELEKERLNSLYEEYVALEERDKLFRGIHPFNRFQYERDRKK